MSPLHLCGLPVQSGVCSVWTRAERGLRFALLRSSQSADAFQCVMRSAAIAVHVSVHAHVHALIKEFKSLESEFSCVCVCPTDVLAL